MRYVQGAVRDAYRQVVQEYGLCCRRQPSVPGALEFARQLHDIESPDSDKEGRLIAGRTLGYLEHHPWESFVEDYDNKFESAPRIYNEVLSSGKPLLDAGCFMGHNARKLKLDGFRGRLAAIDKNPRHMAIGFLLFGDSPYQDTGIEWVCGDVCDLRKRYQDGEFHWGLYNGLLHSLGDEAKVPAALGEAERVIRPGGRIFGSTFSATGVRDPPKSSDGRNKFVLLHPTQLMELLDGNGFTDAEVLEEPARTPKGEVSRIIHFYAVREQ